MKTCYYCKEEIKDKASRCPHCQKDLSASKAVSEFAGAVLGLLFWGTVFVLVGIPAIGLITSKN
jgi:hypothetical protein